MADTSKHRLQYPVADRQQQPQVARPAYSKEQQEYLQYCTSLRAARPEYVWRIGVPKRFQQLCLGTWVSIDTAALPDPEAG